MRYIGIFLMLLSAVFIDMAFSKTQANMLSECSEFIMFLRHIRVRMLHSAAPVCECALGFYSKRLYSLGFILAIQNNDEPTDAFLKIRDKLSLSKKMRELLDGFFTDLGSFGLDEEIKKLDACIASLGLMYDEAKQKGAKDNRLMRTSLYALSLSLAIILV